MPHLTADDRAFFKENGYLIRRCLVTPGQIAAAQDALWEGIEADRDDPSTWIGAGPRVPVPSSHPAIRATLHESPVFAIAEELVGHETLGQGGAPGPHLVFPSGDDDWPRPSHGHLDGYYTPTNGVPEGTVGLFHVGTTIYVEDIEPRGGGFTLWPGTHRQAAEYFQELRPQHPHGLDRAPVPQGSQRHPLRDPRRHVAILGRDRLMDLVLSAASLPDLELPELLDAAGEAGYDAVELFRDRTASSVAHPDYSVRRLRGTLEAASMRIGAYEVRALTGRKADSDERNPAYNLRQIEWDLHLGRALGVQAIGLRGGARSDEARQDLIEGVNQLLERVEDVSLLVGPRLGSPLQDAADFDAIVPQLHERARVMLDTGPLLVARQDPVDLAASWSARLGIVRLRDQQGDRVVGLGEGDLALDDLLTWLEGCGFEGPVVVEVPGAQAATGARERLAAVLN